MCGQEKSPFDCADALAGDSTESRGGVGTLNERLLRYAGGKAGAMRLADYISAIPEGQKYSAMLRGCASYLLFKHWTESDKLQLYRANYCKKHLLCPFCAMRRAARYVQAYSEKVSHLHDEGVILPSYKPYMVTFTVKDGEVLAERFEHLRAALKRFYRRRTTSAVSEVSKALGGVQSIEVKRGKNSGLWHPHAHAVWWCETAPDQVQLSSEWRELTGDSFIVDVRPLYSTDGEDTVISGFIEVFKYALKFSDMEHADIWHAHQKLSGRRLVSSFGFLRGVHVPDDLNDDDLALEEPYILMLFKYLIKGEAYTFVGMVDDENDVPDLFRDARKS